MSSLLRWAWRNVVRSKVRTVGVALVVGLTLGIFLILAQVATSINADTDAVLGSVANIVSVSSASAANLEGGFGFGGARTPITADIQPTISSTPDVVSVQNFLSSVLINGSTPTGGGFGGGSGGGPGGGGGGFNFNSIAQIEGIDTTSPVTLYTPEGAETPTVVEGGTLGPSDENDYVALVGQTYATNNNINYPGTIDINGTTFTVAGIFTIGSGSGGNSFESRSIIIPFPAAEAALNKPGPSVIYVTVNSANNVNTVIDDLGPELTPYGSYSVQSVAAADSSLLNTGISSILSSTQLDEYATLAAGAAMMVVVMVIVTTQRTREIGVMKALGYANPRILSQLLLESVVLAAIGLPIAVAISALVGPEIAQALLGSSGSSSFSGGGGSGGGFRGGGGGGSFSFSNVLISNVSFNVTPEILAIGAAITVLFGVLGAVYPVVRALRLRPTEALRHE